MDHINNGQTGNVFSITLRKYCDIYFRAIFIIETFLILEPIFPLNIYKKIIISCFLI